MKRNQFLVISVLLHCKSLHVGRFTSNNDFKNMQKHGHRPIVLLGGSTTLIGDPSGKDTTRKILDHNQIKNNIKSIKRVFKNILNTTNKKVLRYL